MGHISDTFLADLEDILVIAFSPYFANREDNMEKNYFFLNCRNSNIHGRPLSEPALIYNGIDIQRFNSCPERKCNI